MGLFVSSNFNWVEKLCYLSKRMGIERAISKVSVSTFLFHHTMGHSKQSPWIHVFKSMNLRGRRDLCLRNKTIESNHNYVDGPLQKVLKFDSLLSKWEVFIIMINLLNRCKKWQNTL